MRTFRLVRRVYKLETNPIKGCDIVTAAGMPTRAPSMLLDTIRVGPNLYTGVSRACDEAMAASSSVARALFDPFLRGVNFLATKL